MSPRHRLGDGDDEDHTQERQGPWDGPAGITIGYHGAKVSFRGVAVWAALVLIVILGTMLYSGYRQETATWAVGKMMAEEHNRISSRMDMRTCLDTATIEEKKWLKDHWSPAALRTICGWMTDVPDGR